MKSGKMVHVIEVQQAAVVVNDAGTPTKTWSKIATLRAELLEQSTEEFLRNAGDTNVTTIAFRTRFLSGITNDNRVSFDGTAYDIKELVPIGRRRGMEIRCREAAP